MVCHIRKYYSISCICRDWVDAKLLQMKTLRYSVLKATSSVLLTFPKVEKIVHENIAFALFFLLLHHA